MREKGLFLLCYSNDGGGRAQGNLLHISRLVGGTGLNKITSMGLTLLMLNLLYCGSV